MSHYAHLDTWAKYRQDATGIPVKIVTVGTPTYRVPCSELAMHCNIHDRLILEYATDGRMAAVVVRERKYDHNRPEGQRNYETTAFCDGLECEVLPFALRLH